MSSHKSHHRVWMRVPHDRRSAAKAIVGLLTVTLTLFTSAHATLPEWLQHVIGASTLEAALFRTMALPSVQALYPRPPKESQTELARLIASAPNDSQLYALRAQTDESALDFTAAESDWKLSVAHASDATAARLELADFYHRRLLTVPELATLNEVAAAPPIAAERFVNPSAQRSWLAFDRMLALIADQDLPPAQTSAVYQAFLARYPDQPAVYAQFLNRQLTQKDWPAAEALIARYRQAFPQDTVFSIRAQALLDFRRGNIDAALATYDRGFEPLWSPQLIQSYFALLDATHRQRAFVADARARLAAHPDGPEALNALARIFYYDQQAGRLDKAQQTLDAFRIAREARNGAWTPLDVSTLAALTASTHSYAESARYNYALASITDSLPSGEPAAQAGLAALVDLLLTAPDQPLALGAGNLTLYRDIATLDQGPGYWNGILSLWINGTSPQSEYDAETAKAQSYFHRAKAAELLAELDRRFPEAPRRAALHAELVRTYAQYGESAAVLAAGQQFLSAFPASSQRVDIAGLMADAYARQQNTSAEFALYDSLLTELAAKTSGQPLSAAAPVPAVNPPAETSPPEANPEPPTQSAALKPVSYELTYTPSVPVVSEAVAYTSILDRYLGRLVAEKQLPQALTVLRRQLDLHPDDPLLYERLANFLQQNNLSQQQEDIYKLAVAHFQQPGWYDKLARLYLRERNRQAYTALTRQVTDIFSGTDLDAWFRRTANLSALNAPNQPAVGQQLAVQLNLYAQKRFPHDAVFTHNLLTAYNTRPTLNAAAYEDLLRHHWWESDDLRTQFFTFLARTGKLQSELAQLQTLGATSMPASPARLGSSNAAAVRELAEIDIYNSHFEAAAPLMASVAALYPADPTTGEQAVSLFRSLAYLDPTSASTAKAVAIEQQLLAANPADENRLATLGDLYAEATSTAGEDLAAAAPYWRRIPALHPGTPAGFLTSATVFWDYFQFDDALAQLTAARTRFHQPALFGYEAGAIAENRRDIPTAIAEYTAAATLESNPEARSRLLQLAIRPTTKTLVDQASARALAAAPTSLPALNLRADILVAQRREPELTPLLDAALAKASTFDEAAAIGALAQQHTLTPLYERSLEREITLTADPVQKIELSYTLASSLEARRQIPAATRVTDAVYQANPRVLGVVRATTDFYTRTDQPPRAIATLLEAARAATPDLARSFTLEAAQKANESGHTAQARSLAQSLLAANPYNAAVLAVLASSYARANDDPGLKTFYLAQLDSVRTAPLTPDERKTNTALLRRGLIPALTRLKDYPAALDQYIALLSAYPQDSSTAQEAALYALRYNRQPQLLDFLRTTVKQSPSDSRFAILLAQVETTFDDLPGALTAYNAAIAIRKDRTDLYSARADLELRLAQTDPTQTEAAAADFNRLYVLSYKDPSWMVRLAELRARQQRPADAVKALETAYITGQTPSPADQFRVADQLAKWNLLSQARTFAQQGIALAGFNLLTDSASTGASTYARILTRTGNPAEALKTLTAAYQAANANTSVPAAQLAQAGISPADIAKYRRQYLNTRRQTARTQLSQAIAAIGETVQTFYTPEQKLAYAQTLDTLHASNPTLAISAASSAGLADREAQWRKQRLLSTPLNTPNADDLAAYTTLQRRRLAFADLAQTLEAYAARQKPEARTPILKTAAQAYRDAGDETNEIRITRPLVLAQDNALRDRFLDLLLRHDRAALIALAATPDDSLADAAANYAIAHATQPQALAAVAQRGRSLPAVWRPATASLVLTNFASPTSAPTPANIAVFTQPLNSDTSIAQRLATPADPARQLTGDNWFYYGSRFGLFLATVPKVPTLPDPEDFLPAELERSPTSPAGYLHLARNYADLANYPAASAVEYGHAIELAPDNPATHDELAVVLFHSDRRDEALAQWRAALALLAQHQSGEAFFSTFDSVVFHLGQRRLTASFRPELDAVLKPYLARNGNYRSNELLEALYKASATPVEGTSQILAAANFAADPNLILEDLRNASWLTPEARETVLLRHIELARSKPASSGSEDLRRYQMQLVVMQLLDLYLHQNQIAKAQQLLATVKTDPSFDVDQYRIVIATRTARLQPLLDQWTDQPDTIPEQSAIANALLELRTPTPTYTPNPASILPLQQFVFDRKQLTHTLNPTDFLALAQTCLETNNLPAALDLLHRLSLQPSDSSAPNPNPYANTDSAAALLESTQHLAEAIPFLTALTQSVPWNPTYRLRLAEAQLKSATPAQASPALIALARDTSAPYATRLAAAADLATLTESLSQDLGSAELTLLAANPHPSPTAARQPYLAAARLAAAAAPTLSKPDRIALLREAIAIDPSPRATLDLLLTQTAADPASTTLALYNALINARPTPISDPDTEAPDNSGDTDSETVAAPDADPADRAPTSFVPPPPTFPFALAQKLDRPTQIRLAVLLASAFQRDRNPAQSLYFDRLAVNIDALNPRPDPVVVKRLTDYEATLALERKNALRRPVVHTALDQPNQVRPRLTLADQIRAETP